MGLTHIPLAQVDERELRRLIDAKAAEARDIEYKRDTYGLGDADHANGSPTCPPSPTCWWRPHYRHRGERWRPDGARASDLTVDVDQEILRLEQISRSNLEPRIAHPDFKRVPIATGGEVLVVRIPRSFNPPHRIVRTGKGQNRFWARSSDGKYEPNVDELRALFTLAPQLTERIRDFRAERLAKIVTRAAPVTLVDQACLIMHVVPFSSFDPGGLLPIVNISNNPHPFAPMGSSGAQNWFVNFDGVLILSNADRASLTQRAYVQVYRTGRLESVTSSIISGEPPGEDAAAPHFDQRRGVVLTALVRSLKGLQALGVEPPYAVMISLIGVNSAHMNVGAKSNWLEDDEIRVLTEDQFHFTEVILESVPNSIQECGKMLKPFIEQLANTAGQPTSSSFGPRGEYLRLFQ